MLAGRPIRKSAAALPVIWPLKLYVPMVWK
jgi:hypothetical protein